VPINKDLNEDQLAAIAAFFKDRTSMPEEETMEFIEANELPWTNVAAFRMWAKDNEYFTPVPGSGGGGSTRKAAGPSVRGINKFNVETSAMATARLLLEDKDKALSGAISQLEEEVKQIELEAEQQISIIKTAAEEQVKTRQETIDQLREQLADR
jgi:hypothetical protein